jgi:hypothetical protein
MILEDFCDICSALLSRMEKDAGLRFGQCLCDHCNGEVAAANPGLEPQA